MGSRRLGDVDVDDVELNVINYEGDSLVLNDGVTREQLVGGQGGEGDGVMDEGDEPMLGVGVE